MKVCLTLILVLVTLTSNNNETYICQPGSLTRADFRIAYKLILKHEGYWVNDPSDAGGETYCGITKRFSKDWYGWRYVDATKNKKWNDSIPEATMWVLDFYLSIWAAEGFYKLENQEIANYVFDTRIHLHTKQTIKLINETYGYDFSTNTNWIDNRLDTVRLCDLQERRKQFYLRLIKRKPHYIKFKRNWLRRAEYV